MGSRSPSPVPEPVGERSGPPPDSPYFVAASVTSILALSSGSLGFDVDRFDRLGARIRIMLELIRKGAVPGVEQYVDLAAGMAAVHRHQVVVTVTI